jgi:DNA helicase II / ATP-dependent DNA helicase PcrA
MSDTPSTPEWTEPPSWIAEEVVALDRVLPLLRALQQRDHDLDVTYQARVKAAHAAWSGAHRDNVQREALQEELEAERMQLDLHRNARKSRVLPFGTPYFARMVLTEATRTQEVMLGKVGVVESGLRIVDWRHAPVSRLYYEYEEAEEFADEVAGRIREGVLTVRRRVDVRDGVLVEAQRNDETLRRTSGGSFLAPIEAEHRAERTDHRLPDIVSLITREQFAVVAQPDAGVVLLRGRAGSGKTTVALHRVAWLHFQDPARFAGPKILVVMFNKALQTYIAKVLPELGVPGVTAVTFHRWAIGMLRDGGIQHSFVTEGGAEVGRLKRHPAMEAAIAASLDRLGERLGAWAVERSPESADSWAATRGGGLNRLATFLSDAPASLRTQVRRRLDDHPRDLWALLEDSALLAEHLPPPLHRALPAVAALAARCREQNTLTFEDAALLLRIGQLKRRALPDLRVPWAGRYSHVVIDEAQDLSTLELAALVDASDAGRSVTIAGDPAQKIIQDAWFDGFEPLLQRLGGGSTEIRLQALQVGHRSTRPIMTLALLALGQVAQGDLAVAAARDGEPVEWLQPLGDSDDAWVAAAAKALVEFREARPLSLVAVLCLHKSTADRWATALERHRVADVRRAERAEFRFAPGVVVSNVHQVKGLEFDGVLLIDPGSFGERDRHLLHVAITRAADRLWVVAPKGPGLLRAHLSAEVADPPAASSPTPA